MDDQTTTGQAILSQPAPSHARTRSLRRPRGGTLRSGAQSALVSGLFVSGLWLWAQPQAEAVLWTHVAGGLVLIAALAPWLVGHVRNGLAKSGRRLFTHLSWALLALWVTLLASGLAMAAPALIWFAGRVWFPARAVTEALSLVHYWASWLALGGFILHLGMRHWRRTSA